MGLKRVFEEGGFNRYKMVTEYQEWDEAEIERQKQIASKESQRREALAASDAQVSKKSDSKTKKNTPKQTGKETPSKMNTTGEFP